MLPPDWGAAFARTFRITFILAALAALLARETPLPGDVQTSVRYMVGARQFNFVTWTLDALALKAAQSTLAEQNYLPEAQRKQIVLDYLDLVEQIDRQRGEIRSIFSDPAQADPAAAAAPAQAELDRLLARQAQWRPLAEAILQEQIAVVLVEQGFGVLGAVFPPVSFRSTPLPSFLVVSPRARIERIANAELAPGLTAEDEAELEARIDRALDVSSLVVPLGGIGTYPAMLYETSNLGVLLDIGAHEWSHNYLTLRPLGLSYEVSGDLRTMNETTATIFGQEISALVLERFYPERAPPPSPPRVPALPHDHPDTPQPPRFDFNAEMRQTRVRVDELLAEGRVLEAEAFMEQRRQVFLAHGYQVRKINQAYFAFYGAYADRPGAGGRDPVGPAVTALRERSPSLKAFVDRMAWMTSFEDLQGELEAGG